MALKAADLAFARVKALHIKKLFSALCQPETPRDVPLLKHRSSVNMFGNREGSAVTTGTIIDSTNLRWPIASTEEVLVTDMTDGRSNGNSEGSTVTTGSIITSQSVSNEHQEGSVVTT